VSLEIPVRGQSVLSVKGQTVIPKEIREALGIEVGAKLAWILSGGKLTVFPLPSDPVRALRGVLKGYGTYAEWLAERNEERKRERDQDEAEERRWQATSSTPRQ
jgi:AbrB family looped-hinge helix DNA binding protein